jgi:hypothetical protein
MAGLEGAGALGFSQPIKSDAESIAKQVTRLANQQARQAYTRANTIQKAEEKLERTLGGYREDAYRASNYIASGYGEHIGVAMHDLVAQKLEGMLKFIDQTQSPPQALVADLKQDIAGEREFVGMVKQEESQIKQNKDLNSGAVIDMYFNSYIKPNDIAFYKPGEAIGPLQWFMTSASDEQIRSSVASAPGYWLNFFKSKSQIESQRQVQSQVQGGARQTETTELDVALNFVKTANGTVVPKTALELMDASQNGMSLLQVATSNYQDRIAVAMLNEQRDIWANSNRNEMVEFEYQDADGNVQVYSKTVGQILSDPDDFGNQYLLAKGLEEATRNYGINRVSSGVTVSEIQQPIIISPQSQRSNADTYAREDKLIRTINTLSMGQGNLGDKILKDGKVLYPVEDAIFAGAEFDNKRVKVYFNPGDNNFLVIEEKQDLLSFKVTDKEIFNGDELATELSYRGVESGSVQMRMNDHKVTVEGQYNPEAYTDASSRTELDADPESIYRENQEAALDVIGTSRSTLSREQIGGINDVLKKGGVKTASGTITRVSVSMGNVVVSFEGKARQTMSFAEFITLINSRETSAVTRYGQRKTIDMNVLDVLRGKQSNIA